MGGVWTSWGVVSVTGAWAFLRPPSPSPPPRRRKGRGRSNRSGAPARGGRHSEDRGDDCPRVQGPHGGCRGTTVLQPKTLELFLNRKMLVKDICLTFKVTVEQDAATCLLSWRQIYISSIYSRITDNKSSLFHLKTGILNIKKPDLKKNQMCKESVDSDRGGGGTHHGGLVLVDHHFFSFRN